LRDIAKINGREISVDASDLTVPDEAPRRGNESNHSDVLAQVLKDILVYSAWGIPGSLIGTWLIDTPLGRRYTMAAGAFGTSISVFMFSVLTTRIGTIICCSAISLFTTIKYAVIYGYTAEVFETKVRGTANGIASACARM
ncbi:11130_t:CDS:2, partial [Racocetra fulgida]